MVQVGTIVQVDKMLGMGASGTVLKAKLTQPVAIKRANRHLSRVGEEEEAARRDRVAQDNVDYEARMLAMFKVQTHSSSTYLVMRTWGESPSR